MSNDGAVIGGARRSDGGYGRGTWTRGSRLTGHAHQLHLPPEGGQESPERGSPEQTEGKEGVIESEQH